MAPPLVLRTLLRAASCSALLSTLALPAVAQGPPDIEWQGSHAGHASAAAFSPDGGLVASGSSDHAIKLWRAADGALLRTMVQCAGVGCRGPGAVAFSPDGTLLATAGGGLKLWNVADGSLVRSISVGAASIAFSPDGQTLAESGSGSSYNSRFVRLVRLADGAVLWSVTAGGGGVAFSADGSRIAAVGRGGVDLLQADGAPLWHLDGARSAVAFSADDAVLAVSGNGLGAYRYDETIALLRTSDGSTKRTLTRTGSVTSLAFSADGAHLVAGGWDPNENFVNGFVDSTGTIRIWSLSEQKSLADVPPRVTYDRETGTGAGSVTLSADGSSFAYVHDAAAVLASFPDTSCAMAITPDSAVIPSSGGDGSFGVLADKACAWTAASRVPWITVTGGSSGEGNGTVSFTVDSAARDKAAANGAYDSIVGQIIVAGQSFLVNFGGEGDGCFFILQPDHATFAAGGGDGSVSVYTAPGCSWRAVSQDAWITPTPAIHVSDGGVGYHVEASSGGARVGSFLVGDSPFTVTQEAPP
ncbi:MAG TPA: hypothetical protein VFS60_09625 [Thermoanaerobaculia bacterium]|nr:hypothetical protein [Thermoanaerobaculia bacterium]